MGLRLLVSFPVAAMMIAVLFVMASSYVSAIEASRSPRASLPIWLEASESVCDVMVREIQAISRAALSCDLELQCLGSPILCPITLNGKQEREYLGLRAEFGRRCDTSYSLAQKSGDAFLSDSGVCASISSGSDPDARGRSNEPTTFVF